MRRSMCSLLPAALCALLSVSVARAANVPTAKLTQEENHVDVKLGDKPFTDYYFAAEGGHAYVRPFMWPVRAADGTEVTSDQTRAKEADPKQDHPHHRSLYVAFGDVNGADHWSLAHGADQPKQRHVDFQKVAGDTLVEDLVWEDKQHQPMMKEVRTVRFFAFPDSSRGIDITSVYSAIDKPVKFGDTKEAGLCAARMAKSISQDPTITLSTGATSTQNADKAKKQAGDENNVWGKAADWCDESGTIDGKVYGLTIMSHPSNPLPAKWHVRRYGLIAANNIGASAFDKTNPNIYTPLTIEQGKPVTFRYRVVIHEGPAASAKLDEKFKEYAHQDTSR